MKVFRFLFVFMLMFVLLACGGGSSDSSSDGGWPVEPSYIDPTTEAGDVHYNSGGRRIVRFNGTTIALVNDGTSDLLYRTNDDGKTWTQIDAEGGFSGCLVSGPNDYAYHFSRYGSNVRIVKFVYDAAVVPAPVNIYSSLGSSNHGVYTMINATIDETGNLYVFYHYDTGTGGDSIFLLKSEDEGLTWNSPVTVRSGSVGASYGFVHPDVTPDGDVVIVYSQWGAGNIQFGVSHDKGATWTHTEVIQSAGNPVILPVGNDELYLFAQMSDLDGLVFKKSTDSGASWPNDWTSIQANHANGYADPSPALGDDGTIYVAFRGSETYTSLSDDLRSFIAMSTDGGDTWSFPDNHLDGGRVGTRSTMRYQTWYNYGGPLEWTWLEEDGEDTNIYPTMYDINIDVTIHDLLN